jgi:hypothetical protein
MPVTDSTVPDRNQETRSGFHGLAFISLNQVFEEVIKKLQSIYTGITVVSRCETLPMIRGNRDDVVILIENLFLPIFRSHGITSTLFLHVNCDVLKTELLDGLEKEFRKYQVRIHTNITTDENWKSLHAPQLANCQQILLFHKANFVVNSINHTGCLYSITWPGKL